jgi:hypothetical protein
MQLQEKQAWQGGNGWGVVNEARNLSTDFFLLFYLVLRNQFRIPFDK